ncbi:MULTISPECIES: SDR family NAD(P)-dependent oxidoreductase [unclassified Ruegeria]|uniref:SDR family NAD(P)-dependent oxidoreductase n=1 Tax=unclassified Ruegeria TaxID=2625375 RepID=UPI0014910506|nr:MULTISPECIES: SDR family oxidoreductase [unclassified Ruegeria]NOD77361.1 SDR family oxidoreductase [Ruegeria sp. HKCCD4332]NOD87784.1 SDR family oxidoreductase [Ruegeria sp. HKCCD4318]NOE14154.1 SDR family oxidoreductase [Ruegeria sp. HKCCD4318-2]NOG08489.1 SDR family oxidoreductase [Ruegeria sp. HKCCD4315]
MDKVALITGGARGIGRAIVENLGRDHKIAFTWLNSAPDLDVLDGDVLAIRSDLTQQDQPTRVIDQVIAQFGRLDVIVNNAGLVRPTPKEAFNFQDHRDILDLNLLAPVALLTAALPHLQAGASIVNISSMNATLPPRDAATYGASKAALNLWTRAMAKELGSQGIRVNAIAPGAINIPEAPRSDDLTELFVKDTALGRVGVPEDIAKVVRFLASDEAGFVTGEVLGVTGGYRL